MSVSLSGKVRIVLDMLLVSALADSGSVQDEIARAFEQAFANGTGLNQANNVFHDYRALTSGSNEDLDVAAALVNSLGATLTFSKIKGILIVADAANTTDLTVSRPASNGLPFLVAAGDAFVLKPGGMFLLTNFSAAGIAPTADTADLIHVVNGSGATAHYTVVLIGCA